MTNEGGRRPDHLLVPALALVTAILLTVGAAQVFLSMAPDTAATTSTAQR